MQSLILHPTSIAQWHALLLEAQQSAAISLQEDLESYLVFLLMRFSDNPQLAASVLGLDFLNAQHQYRLLKDVGDKCLLYAGLFPGRALKKRVKISYFVKLGQSAYSMVSNTTLSQEHLYNQLCIEFPKLMDVLHAMRDHSCAIDLLQSFELWHEAGSIASWNRIQQLTKGLPVAPRSDPHKKFFN